MTPPKDFRRLAENVYRNYGKHIDSKDDFYKWYKRYLSDLPENHPLNDERTMNSVADVFYRNHVKGTMRDRGVDYWKTGLAEITERTEKEFKQERKRVKHEYLYSGRSGGKVVKAYLSYITIKGRKREVFRGSNGRFVRVVRKG